MSASKDVRKLIKQAEGWQGWTVKEIKAGWMLMPPDKSLSGVTVHRTPSDHRHWQNTLAQLRKRGAPV